MGVLVRVRHPCVGVEAGIGDHHHALLGVVVEAEDLVAEQLELELGDVLAGLEQPERLRAALSRACSSGG